MESSTLSSMAPLGMWSPSDREDLDMAKRCEVGVGSSTWEICNCWWMCFLFLASSEVVVTPPKSLRWQWKITMFFFSFPLSCSFSGVYMVYPSISVYMWFEGLRSSTIIFTRPWKCFRVGVLSLHRNVHHHQLGVFFLFRSILNKQLLET